MKKSNKSLMIIVCTVFFMALSFSPAISANEVTVSGTVNDFYGIETDDGEVYEIGDSEQGDELIGLVGARVEVTGTVEEDEDGVKIITVSSFVILEESSTKDIDIYEEEAF